MKVISTESESYLEWWLVPWRHAHGGHVGVRGGQGRGWHLGHDGGRHELHLGGGGREIAHHIGTLVLVVAEHGLGALERVSAY